jgi:hypothetical protein
LHELKLGKQAKHLWHVQYPGDAWVRTVPAYRVRILLGGCTQYPCTGSR